MAKKYLDSDGLLYLWQKIKNLFATKTDAVKSITRSGTTYTVTRADGTTFTFDQKDYLPANTAPLMDGTAAIGTSEKYAREDHVHPSDNTKVDKVTGKGLSTNDLTNELLDKLVGIASGAEVNVQPNWSVTDTTSDAYILNKPNGTADPLMDGTAAVGTSLLYSREDHVHPSDTTKVDKTTTVNGHALSNNITLDSDDVGAVSVASKGVANGVCPLDSNAKINSSYLPSYVDDVIEVYPRTGATVLSSSWFSETGVDGAALTPESGVLYVLLIDSGEYAANTQFRWGSTQYVKLNDGGVTSITNAEIDTIVAT